LSDHPLPTERSLQAGEAAFGFVRGGDVVALISGGTSALLCAPAPGITLEEKRGIADTLIRSGASIGEINLVRRHLSRIKGGGLGAAGSGRVLTLVASDVIGGEAHEVGSGPTVVDPSTVAEARAVLDRYGLDAPLAATIGPSHPRASAFEHRFVAQPVDLAGVVRVALEAEGLTVFDMPPTGDDVESLARAYAGLATSLNPGQALVRSAEPTVAVPAKAGKGGRSTHLAALAAALLPDDVVLLCGASDGTDGASGTAGAVVTRAALARYDVARALRAFDAGSLHVAAGTHLDTRGPTGLNLCDVHVLARAAAA
jgi:hydroxypyruvate reductase